MIPAAQIAALIALGFVVVTPEYCLSPQVSAYAGAIADAKACLAWAQDALPALLASAGVAADGGRDDRAAPGRDGGGAAAGGDPGLLRAEAVRARVLDTAAGGLCASAEAAAGVLGQGFLRGRCRYARRRCLWTASRT